jgi:hypothetical protein
MMVKFIGAVLGMILGTSDQKGNKKSRPPSARRLRIEPLEDRVVLSYDFLGPGVAMTALPSGYAYRDIESWVPAGQEHGAPYVVGQTLNDASFALVVGTENNGALTWGAPIAATHNNPNEVNPRSLFTDLIRSSDGSPVILGGDKTDGEYKATSWVLNQATMTLVPTLHPFPSNLSEFTGLIAGDAAGNYLADLSGSLGVDVGGTLVRVSATEGGLDRLGGTIVGGTDDGNVVYLTQNTLGGWDEHTPALPSWSTGLGLISDISTHIMGGYLYDPNAGDSVPALWLTDGALINSFASLAGYTVNEIIEDQGVNVALLNAFNFDSPSYIWAEGWDEPRLVFGDILPALPDGVVGTVLDFSSGGSEWLLARYEQNGAEWFSTVDVSTRPQSSEVPEPLTALLIGIGVVRPSLKKRFKTSVAH